ncbi:MAG: HAD-IA family hydrolase [Chlorobium sp.]
MSIILLDIGNVVVSFDFMRFCEGVAEGGVAESQELYRKYCEGELKKSLDCGMITPHDYLAMIASDPMTRTMPDSDLIELWQNIFTPLKGAEEGVKLVSREHRLWIMSDTDPMHFTFLLEHYPVLRNRERYILSCESGLLKSSPEAFLHLLSASGYPAHEFLLIDDKPENCTSAAEVGIKSILFDSWPGIVEAVCGIARSQHPKMIGEDCNE